MKKYSIISVLVLLFISSFTFADGGDHGKESNRNYDHMNTPPKVKTAPFINGVANNGTLEIFKDGKHHKMIVDKTTDNILFDNLNEGSDFVRVYTDYSDGNECLLIWRKKKVDKESGDITWKKYTYKFYEDLGWRPVDNSTTKVKSFD
ncbi:hypothetical protein [Flammeovirga pacifica]|uniref:Uncharacterized protein n=1 Tax=Flammeovirga pacifica TaxID=915059 RepID=A0A1S1Z4P9_FLAPC|nr:hypothetical protein [Flammeovirga pacifica]OHX68264.1 hypothetical protein NH26_18885 [Flammeovirga pacifica]